MVRAWFMDTETTDQRLEHQRNPPEFVTLGDLYAKTGVEYFKVIYSLPYLHIFLLISCLFLLN